MSNDTHHHLPFKGRDDRVPADQDRPADGPERGGEPDESRSEPIPSRDDRTDEDNLKHLRSWLRDHQPPSRQDGLFPYLLIRAFPGDTGIRQPGLPVFWESPDIRVVVGDVADPNAGVTTLHPVPGQVHTVFVHVWNLGRLPAVGVKVRAWWANPSFSFDANSPEPPHLIGAASVNLGDKSRADCHGLVRVGTWTPVVENGGHECLLAVADHILDPAPGGFEASLNRHVGQRNMTLATAGEDLSGLMGRLGHILPFGADLELLHAGRQVAPILLAHGLPVEELTTANRLTNLVHPVADLHGIGHLGAVLRTPIGRMHLTPARLAPALIRHDRSEWAATSVLDRTKLLPGPAPFAAGENPGETRDVTLAGASDRQPFEMVRTSAATAIIQALGVRDLTAGSIAKAIDATVGASNLLRFQAVSGGVVRGGYSVIVS